MKLRPKRIALWLVVAAVAVVILLALRPSPQRVDFATVARGSLQVTLDQEGETRVRERYAVSAPLAGRVLRIELEPGDPVVAGQTVLATFQPSDPLLLDARSRAEAQGRSRAAQAALGGAEAQRQSAAAELEFRRSEIERMRRLAEQGIVSREDLEASELALHSAEKGLEAADYAVRNARFQLEVARAALLQSADGETVSKSGGTITLRSPVDGRVLRRLRESESVVPAGEPLLEVGDPRELEIVADYLSRDAVRITPGMVVVIDQWGGEEPLSGAVRRVEPAGFMKISALGVEERRVNVIIDLDEVPPVLGDGYRVQVQVVVWQGDDVLKVPVGSLFRLGDGWAVFVVEDGKAHRRPIEVGHRSGIEAEILGGVEQGETVVVHPGDAVDDGVAVKERTS